MITMRQYVEAALPYDVMYRVLQAAPGRPDAAIVRNLNAARFNLYPVESRQRRQVRNRVHRLVGVARTGEGAWTLVEMMAVMLWQATLERTGYCPKTWPLTKALDHLTVVLAREIDDWATMRPAVYTEAEAMLNRCQAENLYANAKWEVPDAGTR